MYASSAQIATSKVEVSNKKRRAMLSAAETPITNATHASTFGQHIITFIMASFAVFTPLKSMILALLFLVIVDTITGIAAAIITKKPLTSRKLSRTIAKTLVYITTVCVVFVANKFLLSSGDFSLPLDTLIASFIGLTELKSILENLHKIQKQPLLQYLIDKLASDTSSVINQIDPDTELQSKPRVKRGKKNGTSNRPK